MATTIPYQMMLTYLPGSAGSQPIFTIKAGATEIVDGAVVKLSSGTAIACAANDNANILGIIQGDSFQVFKQVTTGLQGVFGKDQVGTGLFPSTPGDVRIATLGPPILVVGNLPATTGWISGGTNQATYGTSVGLNLDATTGFYFFDDQQSNKIGTVQGALTFDGNVLLGPPSAASPVSPTGLLGARVLVSWTTSTLAVVQGE